MTQTQFTTYRQTFIAAARNVLAGGGSDVLSEAAFPAYANPNPLMNFLFWERLRKIMEHLREKTGCQAALDFGTGSGVMLPFLSQVARQATGVDVDLSPFKKISAFVPFPQNSSVVELSPQNGLRQWKDGSFDVILALDVLEHVPELETTVAELRRLLSPGGEFIVSGPTENFVYKIGRKLAGKEYSGHYHVRNIYDIRRVLEKHFEVRTLGTLYYPAPLFKLYVCRNRK